MGGEMTDNFTEVCDQLRSEIANKAYVVMFHEYDERYVVAVLLDREEAERFVNKHDDLYEIEEVIIGLPNGDDCIRRVWQCDIDLATGFIGRQLSLVTPFASGEGATKIQPVSSLCVRVTSSVSRAHAQKVAIEQWREHIRVKEGSYD